MAVKPKPKATKKMAKPKFSKETYVKWYKDMLLIRKFEEKTGQLYICRASLVAATLCQSRRRSCWGGIITRSDRRPRYIVSPLLDMDLVSRELLYPYVYQE